MQNASHKPLGLGLTTLGALARLAPHPANMTPVGALSLFAGGRLKGWQAYLLPLALMAVTDPLVGGYSFATPFVYASLLINVWIGSRWMRGAGSPLRIGACATAGSLQFFLLTNFGAWLGRLQTYPHTLAGLGACYVAAIPFYARTLAGDLMWSVALFGMYALISRRYSEAKPSVQAAV